jgi:hypothetical protein
MDPIAEALFAVTANLAGNTADAQQHLEAARQGAQTCARRHRQVVEIATLLVTGALERAEGLALVHIAEFPHDADLLTRMTGGTRQEIQP